MAETSSFIASLTKLAEELDSMSQTKIADVLDQGTKMLIQIKQAQATGFQGWAVRNSRCWGKCYRNKRAGSPSKSAQEVWQECWDEYNDAVKGKTDKWDKYAETDAEGIKVASVGPQFDDMLKRRFASAVSERMGVGSTLPVAIASQLEHDKSRLSRKVITIAERLSGMAERLQEENPEIAAKMADASQQILKEAGLGNLFGLGTMVQDWRQNRSLSNAGTQTAIQHMVDSLIQQEMDKNPNFTSDTMTMQLLYQQIMTQGRTYLNQMKGGDVGGVKTMLRQLISPAGVNSRIATLQAAAAAKNAPPATPATPPGPTPTPPAKTPPPKFDVAATLTSIRGRDSRAYMRNVTALLSALNSDPKLQAVLQKMGNTKIQIV